jgi:hypothetical protein
MAAGKPGSGVDGDPRGAKAELGRVLLDFKIDSAVAQIRRLRGRGCDRQSARTDGATRLNDRTIDESSQKNQRRIHPAGTNF